MHPRPWIMRLLTLAALATFALPASAQPAHDPRARTPPGSVVLSEEQVARLLDAVAKLHLENERLKRAAARAQDNRYIGLYGDGKTDGSIVWQTCQPGTVNGPKGPEGRMMVCRRQDGSVALLSERPHTEAERRIAERRAGKQ